MTSLPPPGLDITTSTNTVHEHRVDGFGMVRVVPVVPARDLDLIVAWVRDPRAAFWGMTHEPRERVLEIYEYLDALPSHHTYLVFRDDSPAALLQTYDPAADVVGTCYDVRPGDLGVHLLVAGPGEPAPGTDATRPGHTAALLLALASFVRTQSGVRRIVVEPDAGNTTAIRRLQRSGFTLGAQTELPDKRAQLAFLDLDAFGQPDGQR